MSISTGVCSNIGVNRRQGLNEDKTWQRLVIVDQQLLRSGASNLACPCNGASLSANKIWR